MLKDHNAFLVACYSPHPLVTLLKSEETIRNHPGKLVTGIFEASITSSLQFIQNDQKFGIVSTGKVWEQILSVGVHQFLGTKSCERFSGVQTTGLNATELHTAPQEEVRERMKEATKRLVKDGDVGAVCLGCAGMSGMDDIVREACVEALGNEKGRRVKIVDGVQAGVLWLDGCLKLSH